MEENRSSTWSEQQLVSVDGTPIHVLGSATFKICLAGKNFRQQMVVATTGAILGLDFLQSNRAIIDLEKQQISFNKGEETFPIGVNNHKVDSVCATETVSIPSCSELEEMARVQ